MNVKLLSAAVCLSTAAASAQSVRVLRFSEGKPFQMGKVTSMRIVQPDVGAKQLTLNYSFSQPGSEFSQHVHDHSDDTILILEGKAYLRQGDLRTTFHAGQCALVPAGQIHGTITTAPDTVMISFQVPPDLVLYTGARDASRPGAAAPKGDITPGAVRFFDFADKNGVFLSPSMGAKRAIAAYRKLDHGQSFQAEAAAGHEQMVFVWKGSVVARSGKQTYTAGEKDTIFSSGPIQLTITNQSSTPAIVVHVQAPAPE